MFFPLGKFKSKHSCTSNGLEVDAYGNAYNWNTICIGCDYNLENNIRYHFTSNRIKIIPSNVLQVYGLIHLCVTLQCPYNIDLEHYVNPHNIIVLSILYKNTTFLNALEWF